MGRPLLVPRRQRATVLGRGCFKAAQQDAGRILERLLEGTVTYGNAAQISGHLQQGPFEAPLLLTRTATGQGAQ